MRITARRIIVAAVIVTVGGLATTAMASHARDGGGGVARVTMRDAAGAVVGSVRFTGDGAGTAVRVSLQLDPANAGTYHGFHVHANNDPANGDGCIADPAAPNTGWFVSADGHWKVDGQNHSAHLGDMASLYVTADGTVDARFTLDRFSPSDLAGRAVIVHAGPDNFGNVPVGDAMNQYTPNSPEASTMTANTGNAGARIACGVVGSR